MYKCKLVKLKLVNYTWKCFIELTPVYTLKPAYELWFKHKINYQSTVFCICAWPGEQALWLQIGG